MSMSQDCVITTTAVAIDRDKNSQHAVKWTVENLLKKNGQVILVHVRTQSFQTQDVIPKEGRAPTESEMQQLFLPYRGFCARKGIRAKEVVIHDIDVGNALVEYVRNNYIGTIVVGASSRSALTRAFRNPDVPGSLTRSVPDFCSVYVVSKGKSQNVRSAVRSLMHSTPNATTWTSPSSFASDTSDDFKGAFSHASWKGGISDKSREGMSSDSSSDYMQTPSRFNAKSAVPQNAANSDAKPHFSARNSSFNSGGFSGPHSIQSTDMSFENLDGSRTSDTTFSSQVSVSRELEDEMRRLKLELRQTMDMCNSANKEASHAKEKAREIDRWKSKEAQKLDETKNAQETALAMVEIEKQKCKAALEAAQMAQRLAELESQKRKQAELKAQQEAEEKQKVMNALARRDIQYRKYTIEEIELATNYFMHSAKIGEGGYGPVYKAFLDHTPVAIKVLRPDISSGQQQFQREIEVLSSMRHPHMVLLLGACPEYGCLVYEYMENGSLEDRLFRRNKTPTLSWKVRFKIAAEIATALLFLHQTKPEPLVHRDLKPANILLDGNLVSKISDVGLARLVPPSVADSVTQYHMTAAAGTFCYIDPEYQQTGMLGTKSDIYSFGVMLLQIITAKPAIGLTHQVEKAIERGKFAETLDPTVHDWPVEEALSYAKLALQCCELRRKDRPDLGSVILPELNRLKDLGGDHGAGITMGMSSYESSFEASSTWSQEGWSVSNTNIPLKHGLEGGSSSSTLENLLVPKRR